MRSGRRFLAKRLSFDEDAAINTFGNLRPETLVERIRWPAKSWAHSFSQVVSLRDRRRRAASRSERPQNFT